MFFQERILGFSYQMIVFMMRIYVRGGFLSSFLIREDFSLFPEASQLSERDGSFLSLLRVTIRTKSFSFFFFADEGKRVSLDIFQRYILQEKVVTCSSSQRPQLSTITRSPGHGLVVIITSRPVQTFKRASYFLLITTFPQSPQQVFKVSWSPQPQRLVSYNCQPATERHGKLITTTFRSYTVACRCPPSQLLVSLTLKSLRYQTHQ